MRLHSRAIPFQLRVKQHEGLQSWAEQLNVWVSLTCKMAWPMAGLLRFLLSTWRLYCKVGSGVGLGVGYSIWYRRNSSYTPEINK